MSGNVVGSGLSALASLTSNFGVVLQKTSHNENDALPLEEQVSSIKRLKWWTGMILVVAGSLIDFVALGYCSQLL